MGEPIGLVGAGSWGTTLAKILGENGKDVMLWAYETDVVEEINREHTNSRYVPDKRLADTVRATTDLAEVCRRCSFILMVVPSHVFRRVATDMAPHLSGGHVIVHCTKGIEQETFRRMSEIIREQTCVRKVGVLSGPNLSKELAERRPAGTLVASKFEEVTRRAQQALHNDYFRVYGGSDVVGAEAGGAFKNIVAIAAGVIDELGHGENTKALLLTRGLSEMGRFGASLGGEMITFGGMAGIGDLMATCASTESRNNQVGQRLAKGETLEEIQAQMYMVAEGVKTARAVHRYALEKGVELPIVAAVHGVLYEGKAVRQAMGELMSRAMKREFAFGL